jgi:hypothetical protein
MRFQAFLIKYGEIGVKGKNRYIFEDALMNQIRFSLKEVEGTFYVHKSQGRIYVECEGYYDYEETVEALKRVFPNFDLRTELQNPVFARMTSPNVGVSVEDAYHAVHRKEIMSAGMQVTAQQTAQAISNAIQAGSRRPAENGTSGQSASVTTFDYSRASKAQRDALKREIYAAKARGEKLYPGR